MSMPLNQAIPALNQAGQVANANPTVTNGIHQLLAQGFTPQQIMEEVRRLEYAQLAQQHSALTTRLQELQTEYAATNQSLSEVNQALQDLQTQQHEDTAYLEALRGGLVPSLAPAPVLPS